MIENNIENKKRKKHKNKFNKKEHWTNTIEQLKKKQKHNNEFELITYNL